MPAEFSITRIVQFSETDMAGILHFANYYRMMEEVEHAFWRSVGQSVMTRTEGTEIGWPRVKTACEYFAPAHFEDELKLSLKVIKVGRSSVSYEIEFRRGEERLALGHATAACCSIDARTLKPIRIPGFFREPLVAIATSQEG
jgi:acyl-CoA thioester hydrolase